MGKSSSILLIKPIWWRHACFTFFLFLVCAFFAFVNKFGPVFSWVGTVIMFVVSLLSLLDQIFLWSRLRVDEQGFSLRGWFKNYSFSHHEIKDFQLVEFAGKKLLTIELSEESRKHRGLTQQTIPFPCSFGQPVEEVLKKLRLAIDRTPRPRSD